MSSDARYPKWKNSYSPAPWFLKKHKRMEKTVFKKQLNKWKNNNEFEIQYQGHATSARWAWS